MSGNLSKKIFITSLVPIFILIIGWATWVTNQAFSAQRTEIILQEYRSELTVKQKNIRNELKSLRNDIIVIFEKLNNKIDEYVKENNNKIDEYVKENNKILMDLQKQIAQIKK